MKENEFPVKFQWSPYDPERPVIPLENISKFDQEVDSPIYFEPEKLDENEVFHVVEDYVLPNVLANRYLVSNYGRVYDIRAGKFLNPVSNAPASSNKNPYYKVKLSYVSDPKTLELKAKDMYIHRIVMKSFHPIPNPNEMEIDHADSDHLNNRDDNLSWVSHKQNMKYASERDEILSGEDHPNAKITNEEIHVICRMLQNGFTNEQIMKTVPKANTYLISSIKSKALYSRISDQYSIPTPKEIKKSNNELAEEVCKLLEKGERIVDICKELNVGRYFVNDIKSGRNYREISKNYNIPSTVNLSLPDATVHEICKRLVNGEDTVSISRDLKVPLDTVQRIRAQDGYKHISLQYNLPGKRSTYITDEQAHKVCKLLELGFTPYRIHQLHPEISESTCNGIKYKRSFTNISAHYKF